MQKLKHIYFGRSLKEWAKYRGVSYSVILSRIQRGWDIKDALAMPLMKRGAKGRPFRCLKTGIVYKTQRQAAKALGISHQLVNYFLKRGNEGFDRGALEGPRNKRGRYRRFYFEYIDTCREVGGENEKSNS